MAAEALFPPWLNAWCEAQQALSQVAGKGSKAEDASLLAMRRLLEFGGDYAGIAADCWQQLQAGETDFGGLRGSLVKRYQRLFMPVTAPLEVAANPLLSGTATRCQQATERFSRHAAAIAINAFERLSASLAAKDPAAPRITSLRELYELWIECGEAAYSDAAHGEDFAEAQGELLASFIELHHEQRLRR